MSPFLNGPYFERKMNIDIVITYSLLTHYILPFYLIREIKQHDDKTLFIKPFGLATQRLAWQGHQKTMLFTSRQTC